MQRIRCEAAVGRFISKKVVVDKKLMLMITDFKWNINFMFWLHFSYNYMKTSDNLQYSNYIHVIAMSVTTIDNTVCTATWDGIII